MEVAFGATVQPVGHAVERYFGEIPMLSNDSPQMKVLRLTWATLDWDKEGEARDMSRFLPLPEGDTLSDREREDLDWVVARDKRKFACMPMLRDDYPFEVAPLFTGLLQTPIFGRLWAELGDYFMTASIRGTMNEVERAWLDMGLLPILVNGWVQAGNIAVAAANGITADDILAIREGRLDALHPDGRDMVDLVHQTVEGTLTAERFREIAEKRGVKWVIEAIGYIVFRYASAIIDSLMWKIQKIEVGDELIEEMFTALRENKLGAQNMMDKEAFAKGSLQR